MIVLLGTYFFLNVLSGNEIGVAISDRNLPGIPQCD